MKTIPFMKWRWLAVALSGIALLTAVVSLGLKQLNWGLDFTGGTLVEVAYSDSADLVEVRETLARVLAKLTNLSPPGQPAPVLEGEVIEADGGFA